MPKIRLVYTAYEQSAKTLFEGARAGTLTGADLYFGGAFSQASPDAPHDDKWILDFEVEAPDLAAQGVLHATLKHFDEAEANVRALVETRLRQIQAARQEFLSLTYEAPVPEPELTFASEEEPPADSGWQPFYVTYGSGRKQGGSYSIVWASEYSEARKYIHEKIGDKFSACYTADELSMEFFSFYPDGQIPLQPHTEE